MGFRVWGLGLRVWCLGFRVSGFGVSGLGFGVPAIKLREPSFGPQAIDAPLGGARDLRTARASFQRHRPVGIGLGSPNHEGPLYKAILANLERISQGKEFLADLARCSKRGSHNTL